jgi:hypothetical protein
MDIQLDGVKEKIPLEEIVTRHDLVFVDTTVISSDHNLSKLLYDVNNFLELGTLFETISQSFRGFQYRRSFLDSNDHLAFSFGVIEETQAYAKVLKGYVEKFQRCRGNKDFNYHAKNSRKKPTSFKNMRTITDKALNISNIQNSHDSLALLNSYFLQVQALTESLVPYEGPVVYLARHKGRDYSDVNYDVVGSAIGSTLKDGTNVAVLSGNSNVLGVLHFTLGSYANFDPEKFREVNDGITSYFLSPNFQEHCGTQMEFTLQQEDNPCNNEPDHRPYSHL